MSGKNTEQESFKCDRCGTCCEKGGPGLHKVDANLVLNKIIEPENFYTIRAGELIRDNVKGGLVYTDTEIIKIRSMPASTTCIFFNGAGNACGIYEDRPSQCRAMQCRDTTDIIDMHVKNRICRHDLFGGISWLWDIIETHELRCSHEKIRILIDQRIDGDETASQKLSEMVSYDQAIRDIVSEKAAAGEAGMLNLVFGMPLQFVIEQRFGIKASKS